MGFRTRVRWLSCLGAAWVLAGSAVANAYASPSPQSAACNTGVGCQLPDQAGWTLSDDNPNGGLMALDNLRVTADGSISSLCWWGVYFDFNADADCGPGTGDDFTITYYYDEACEGMSGSLRAGPFQANLTSKFATGVLSGGSGTALAEYQFEATHPPVAVSAGECLWIEILNHTTQTCFWLWSTSHPADGRSVQSGVLGETPMPFDLAFCVDVATASDGCAQALAATYCTAKVNSNGCTPRIGASRQGSDLMIGAEQVLPGNWACCSTACRARPACRSRTASCASNRP